MGAASVEAAVTVGGNAPLTSGRGSGITSLLGSVKRRVVLVCSGESLWENGDFEA